MPRRSTSRCSPDGSQTGTKSVAGSVECTTG
jgi:hypothetical protein